MAKSIGIDLGTTNSCVAIIEQGDPLVIPNDEGSRTTPSVVGFTKDGERLVGQIARRQAVTNPQNTLYAIKRFIGRSFEDDDVQYTSKLVPYAVIEGDNSDAWVQVDDRKYPPSQISSFVLEKMRAVAEAYLGETIENVVITVPAYFNDAQRQATKDAGRIAGLNVQRIINEPTAAALAYGLDKEEAEKIAVFDLGGGTFDITILEMEGGVFAVRSTNGDTLLGGEDFDNLIIEHLLRRFEKTVGVKLRDDKVAMQRLKEASEKAKHELSNATETDINLPFIASNEDGPVHLIDSMTRTELETLVSELIDRLEPPCRQALDDAGLEPSELDAVVLVGGMTRMPRVKEKVQEIFKMKPADGVNPDEVVAIGAAIQASVLQGDVKDVLLLDVTPLTLGIEIAGGLVEPIIPRNTTIPCRKSKVFTTAIDNQDMVRVKVVQGEREMASDCKELAKVEMHGLPPAPRGIPEIEVMFEIDANGILNVRAKDLVTGKRQATRVNTGGGLQDDEIENMIREAELYRAEDDRRRRIAEGRNQLDGLLYNTSRSFEEFGERLSADDAVALREAIQQAEDALDSTDLDVIQSAHDDLFTAAQLLADAIYSGLRDAVDGGDEGKDEFDDDDFDDLDDLDDLDDNDDDGSLFDDDEDDDL